MHACAQECENLHGFCGLGFGVWGFGPNPSSYRHRNRLFIHLSCHQTLSFARGHMSYLLLILLCEILDCAAPQRLLPRDCITTHHAPFSHGAQPHVQELVSISFITCFLASALCRLTIHLLKLLELRKLPPHVLVGRFQLGRLLEILPCSVIVLRLGPRHPPARQTVRPMRHFAFWTVAEASRGRRISNVGQCCRHQRAFPSKYAGGREQCASVGVGHLRKSALAWSGACMPSCGSFGLNHASTSVQFSAASLYLESPCREAWRRDAEGSWEGEKRGRPTDACRY